jgi:hypothetical protein
MQGQAECDGAEDPEPEVLAAPEHRGDADGGHPLEHVKPDRLRAFGEHDAHLALQSGLIVIDTAHQKLIFSTSWMSLGLLLVEMTRPKSPALTI